MAYWKLSWHKLKQLFMTFAARNCHAHIRLFLNKQYRSLMCIFFMKLQSPIIIILVSLCGSLPVCYVLRILCTINKKCLLYQKTGVRLVKCGWKRKKVGRKKRFLNAQHKGEYVLQNKVLSFVRLLATQLRARSISSSVT